MQSEIITMFFAVQDLTYKRFQCALMPAVNPDTVIGVRVPAIRGFASKPANGSDMKCFLNSLPHKYYEENNLHAFLINRIVDFNDCIGELKRFLPYADNRATCDMPRPKCLKKHTEALFPKIPAWLASNRAFTVRFGIETLMIHFPDDFLRKL